jgi:hypothetical protein
MRLLLCLVLLTLPGLSQTNRTRVLVPGLTYSHIVRASTPLHIHVLDISPDFRGRMQARLATEMLPGLEPLSSLAARHQPVAAVNGGYFVMAHTDGTPGDLAGLSVIEGHLISEAIPGRSALLWRPRERPRVARLSTRLRLNNRRLDGRNRRLGVLRSVGADGQPRHDVTSSVHGEIVQFLPVYGDTTPPGSAWEAVLDAQGNVIEVRSGPGPIPAYGSVLAADEAAARWLRNELPVGRRARVSAEVLENGQVLDLRRLNVVNGGPTLVQHGRVRITGHEEGFAWSPEFARHFDSEPNPRTLAGITANGHLLLVVVDGRRSGTSIGLSLRASAELLVELGAVEGVNLDGGGSSTMVVEGKVVNQPSDAAGERPIGDAILLFPR